MQKNTAFVLKVFLAIADIIAIVMSFTLAYLARIYVDDRPFYFVPQTHEFMWLSIILIPLWLIIIALTGLYRRSVYMYRPREYGRLLIVSFISVMALISYEFFSDISIFPVRIIALYFVAISFVLLIIGREVVQFAFRFLAKRGVGVQSVIIVGDNQTTTRLASYFITNLDYGYKVAAIVAKTKFIPKDGMDMQFSSFGAAIKKVGHPDIILQTDDISSEDLYAYSVEHHMTYMFVPKQDILLSRTSEVEIVGAEPLITVRTTKIVGWGRFVKRFCDIIISLTVLTVALIPMLIISIITKLSEPRAKVFFKQKRLTRFDEAFYLYKFRTMKDDLTGMTPEEQFAKLGQPELSKIYRDNGDQLPGRDPRITKIGRFLRATSLDELPQLFNVLKGDISFVGPRALVPEELGQYENKNLILSIRSGLTGLAQVSGRRNISFAERRKLDIYYVQHWSLLLDFQIILKTITHVLFRRGAK